METLKTPSPELVTLSKELLRTLERDHIIHSFMKTGQTVGKTTAKQVQKGNLLGVEPVTFLKNRGELSDDVIIKTY